MNEMNETIQDKPVVFYIGIAQFFNWNGQPDQVVARLPFVIDHPKLGNCYDVRTSTVQKVLDDGTIITRNTLYKPAIIEGIDS